MCVMKLVNKSNHKPGQTCYPVAYRWRLHSTPIFSGNLNSGYYNSLVRHPTSGEPVAPDRVKDSLSLSTPPKKTGLGGLVFLKNILIYLSDDFDPFFYVNSEVKHTF